MKNITNGGESIAAYSTKVKKFRQWLELIHGKSFRDIKMSPGELKMYLDLRHDNYVPIQKPDETIRDNSKYWCETFSTRCEEMNCSLKHSQGITGVVTDCEFCMKLERG